MSTATLLLSSEEEALIENASKQENWVDDLFNEWRQLSPLLGDAESNHNGVAAGSGDQAAAAAKNDRFWDELQELRPLDADDGVMNNGDHDDQPFFADVDMEAAGMIINNDGVAASCSGQAAPLPSAAAENNGLLVPDQEQVSWGTSMLGGSNELGGGFGHHQGEVARFSVAGAIPPISGGFNVPPPMMLQPSSYTQYSGSMPNITTHQDQSFLQYRDNGVSAHPLIKREICQEAVIAAAPITCLGDYQEYYPGSCLPYYDDQKQVHVQQQGDNYFVDFSIPTSQYDHNSPWPAHDQQPQSWDQMMSFPNSAHHHTMEPIRIPTAIPIPSSSTNANGVGENHQQQQQQKKKHERWTVEEHKNMLRGIMKYGKGNWKSISREFVRTKSAVQIASHAQKLEARQKQNKDMQETGISVHCKRKRRSSIHDITLDHVDTSLSSDN